MLFRQFFVKGMNVTFFKKKHNHCQWFWPIEVYVVSGAVVTREKGGGLVELVRDGFKRQ